MRKFEMPQMTRIQFANENVIATSGGCVAQYCDGFTCPYCEDHENCGVQTPCTQYNCKHYLCPEYVS